jgi:hypothetical protein
MLDLIMPNGKRLADCTGTEVAEMGACLSWLGKYFWTNQTSSKCLTCGKQFVVTAVAQLECEDCEGDPARRREKRARELKEIGANLLKAQMAKKAPPETEAELQLRARVEALGFELPRYSGKLEEILEDLT